MDATSLVIESHPSQDDLRFLTDQVDQHNITITGYHDFQMLACFIRNAQQDIVAGISGYTWGGCCQIEFLWVHPDLRQRGYGSQLLRAAEEEAARRRCHLVTLDTFSFQAPDFYQKRGYHLIGFYEDYPQNH
jgi:ribosomal protein S18 acetylase RimI-like enzyme